MIQVTHTVIYPRTMVVHAHDTFVALLAVHRSGGAIKVALFAELDDIRVVREGGHVSARGRLVRCFLGQDDLFGTHVHVHPA